MPDIKGQTKKIRERLAGKTPREQATLKGVAIAEQVSAFPREKRGAFDVEVLSVSPIDMGVEVLVRVWGADGKQLGFGKDGTVDVERFRFINPPFVVSDPAGDIINDYTDKDGNTVVSRGREDAREAILRRLEGALKAKKEVFSAEKIVHGKIGSTTTVVDYTAGNGSAGGSVQLNRDGEASYAAARDAATASAAENVSGDVGTNLLHNSRGGSNDYYVRRADLQFNTSAIPDGDAISAASVTLYIHATNGQNVDGDTVVLLDNTNNGNINDPITTEDFDDFTSTSIGSRVLSELTDIGANRAITLTTFGAINKTGNTRIGFRLLNDINNTAPAGANSWNQLSIALGSGGDNPFLTIEHASTTAPDVNSTASSGNSWTGGAGPLSWSHVATADSGLANTLGLVFTAYESIPSAAPTWNGVSMTQIDGTFSGVGGLFTAWVIVNPAYSTSGVTISYSWSSGTSYHAGISVLLTNAKQSTTVDAYTSNTSGAATTFATAITTVADNCLALCFGYQNAAPTVTAGANTTMLIGNGGTIWAGRANTATTPAGSTTLNFAAPSGSWMGVMVSIAPPATAYDETYTEALNVTATLNKSTTRVLSQALALTDTVVKSTSRTISEALAWVDTFLGEKLIPAVLTETLAFTDTMTRSIGAVRTEALALTDTALKSISRTIAEALALTDSVLRGVVYSKVLTEALALADVVRKSTSRALAEALALTDSILDVLGKTFTENLAFTDTFSRTWTRVMTLTEALSLRDTATKLLNGSAVIWGRVARNVATWRRTDRDNP